MPVLVHASDLHFGKPFSPEAAEAFLEALSSISPDLVVLSGDFTQRAKVREYRQARAFLEGLASWPLVVTPGNHDVPLYRVWERLRAPLGHYRRYISEALDSVTRLEEVTVVALNSTDPYGAIVNGRLTDRQLAWAAARFREAPMGHLRVLVTHHNLMPAPDFGPYQVMPGHTRILEALAGMEVDLVLGGHLHRGWVATSRQVFPGGAALRRIVLAYAGTATSFRGRAAEAGANSFNEVRVTPGQVEITRHLRSRQGGDFRPECTVAFPRLPHGGTAGGGG